MTKKSPKWFSYVNTILDTIGTGSFTPLQDQITYQVMARVVPGLMSKSGIDGGLLNSFITNIQTRGGERMFTYTGPLILTRDQKQHARKKGWDKVPALDELRERNGGADRKRIESGLKADRDPFDPALIETYTQVIRTLSALDPQSIHTLSAFLPRDAAETLGSWVLNEMKRNERNHEPDMIRPEDDMRLAGSPDMTEKPQADNDQGAYRDVGGSLRQGSAHREDGGARETRAVVSFFHNDPARPPSANLEVGENRYSLVFSMPDRADEHLYEVCSKAWLKDFANAGGDAIRQDSRIADAQGSKTRYRCSPLYAASDTFGRQAPIVGDAVAVLFWNDDEQPESVTLIVGQDVTQIPLQEFRGRKAKAPTHKGGARLAA